MGFGRVEVSSLSRVPKPPASNTAFIDVKSCHMAFRRRESLSISGQAAFGRRIQR